MRFPSLISLAALAISANLASAAPTRLSIPEGGTGGNTAAGARSALGAASNGVNSDITSLSGLTAITVNGNSVHNGQVSLGSSILGDAQVSISSLVTMTTVDGFGLFNIIAGGYQTTYGSPYQYISTRGASELSLHDGYIGFYTGGTTGTANTAITFVQNMEISQAVDVWFSPRGTKADFFMNNSGQTGIGSSSPTHTLEVGGTFNASGIISGPNYVATVTAGVDFQMGTNGVIRDVTNGASTMYFDVSTGGSTAGNFSWRDTNSFSQMMGLTSTGLNIIGQFTTNSSSSFGAMSEDSNLRYGVSYTGWNVVRSTVSSANAWTAISDGANNAGTVAVQSVFGGLTFYVIPPA